MFQVMAFWQKLQRRVWLRLRRKGHDHVTSPARLSRHGLSLACLASRMPTFNTSSYTQSNAFPLIAKLSFWSRPRVQQVRTTSTLKSLSFQHCTAPCKSLLGRTTTVHRIDQISFRTFPCVSVCIRSAAPFQHFPFYLSSYHRMLPHFLHPSTMCPQSSHLDAFQ